MHAYAVRQAERPLYRRDYAYSANGNLAQVNDTRHGERHYQYDPLDRLTGVRHARDQDPENFSHDPAGNLLIHDRPGPGTSRATACCATPTGITTTTPTAT